MGGGRIEPARLKQFKAQDKAVLESTSISCNGLAQMCEALTALTDLLLPIIPDAMKNEAGDSPRDLVNDLVSGINKWADGQIRKMEMEEEALKARMASWDAQLQQSGPLIVEARLTEAREFRPAKKKAAPESKKT